MGALPRDVALSLAHSVICVPLGLYALWDVDWLWKYDVNHMNDLLVRDFWWATTPATTRAIVYSSLYFFWDLCHEWQQASAGKWENLLHASVGFSSYALVGLWLRQGHILLCLALLNELSTPFYNFYRIANDRLHKEKEQKKDDGDMDTRVISLGHARAVAGELFAMAFFAVRILFMPMYLWCRVRPFVNRGLELPNSRVPAGIALVELSISTFLNFYWFTLIVRAAIRHRPSRDQ